MALTLRVAAAPLVLLLGGCATWPGGAEEEPTRPAVEVVNDRSTFELVPWSGCISGTTVGMCWDGSPENPVDVGVVVGNLEVKTPLDGWRWEAVARDLSAEPGVGEPGVGAEDGRQAVTVEHDDNARRLVLTVPPGGPFAVDLWGRGASGDASYTFIAVGVS